MPFRYTFPLVLLISCIFTLGKLTGHISPLYLPKNQPVLNKIYPDRLSIIDQSGVDFVASGDKPAWTLEIDFSNLIHFNSAQTGPLYMPVPVAVKDESNEKVTYVAADGSEKVEITLQAVACSSKGAERGFTYKVEVRHKNKTYSGCGHYLFPAEQLHDIWALEQLNQRKVPATAFAKGIPTLEIFVLEQKVLGNTGCNTFGGRVSIGKEMIRFSQITATEMACMGRLEKEFLQALTRTNAYRVESGKLILLAGKSEMLRFRKVD